MVINAKYFREHMRIVFNAAEVGEAVIIKRHGIEYALKRVS